MSPPPTPSPSPSNAPTPDAQAREHEDFWRQQDPVDLAAAEWHTRQEQGLSEQEALELAQWLSARAEHAAALRRLDQGMAVLKSLSPAQRAQARPARTSFEPDARPVPRAGGAPARPAPRPLRPAWLAMACVALLAVAMGVGWHQWHQPTFTSHYATGQGQRYNTTLPDGTELLFDADTQGDVALYRDRREVRLGDGQIMFHVAPDATRPFHVLAGPTRVTVVGTRFSVRHREAGTGGGGVSVTVKEGRVRVAARDDQGQAPVELAAGQNVKVSASGIAGAVTAVSPGNIAPWLKGLVHFENTPLADAVQELERYGPTRLLIQDPQVAALPVGGSYQASRPDEFARVLPRILPVRLSVRDDGRTEIVRAP